MFLRNAAAEYALPLVSSGLHFGVAGLFPWHLGAVGFPISKSKNLLVRFTLVMDGLLGEWDDYY